MTNSGHILMLEGKFGDIWHPWSITKSWLNSIPFLPNQEAMEMEW